MKYLIIKLLIKLGFIEQQNVVDYALNVVEATKPEQWTIGKIANCNGEYCFLGHIAKSYGKNIRHMSTSEVLQIPEVVKIDKQITKYCQEKHDIYLFHSHSINDGDNINGYNEKHPRERMLHVLRDMKADGWDKK